MGDDNGTDEKTPTDIAGAFSLAWFYEDFGDASAALGERAKAISRTIKDSGLASAGRAIEEFHSVARVMCEWQRHLLGP